MISVVCAVRDLEVQEQIKLNLNGFKPQELILVQGENPSLQRNLGVAQATSPLIYFIDDDTVVNPESADRAMDIFGTSPEIAAVGGPAMPRPDGNMSQLVFGEVLSNPWATFTSSARYARRGARRESGEKELILCNMFVRREVFLKLGGFREELYPNEENDFLNRVQKAGYRVIYDPEVWSARSMRDDLNDFVRQCFSYGRGRARQILAGGVNLKDLPNIMTALFSIYAVLAVFSMLPEILQIPFAAYMAITIIISIAIGVRLKSMQAFFTAVLSFLIVHVGYGFGLIIGFLSGRSFMKNKRPSGVEIRKVPL
ncbi:MAG: glycosyltransferase [Spirochaetia bacterium]|nr:glycosyltransferase [Spirochaetia bacterium]